MDSTAIFEAIQRFGLGATEADLQARLYLAEACSVAPCLRSETDPDKTDLALAVIVGAIERRVETRNAVVQSQSAGRQSETIRPAAAPAYDPERFTGSELVKLERICTGVATTALPRGNFPPPSIRLENLFGHV